MALPLLPPRSERAPERHPGYEPVPSVAARPPGAADALPARWARSLALPTQPRWPRCPHRAWPLVAAAFLATALLAAVTVASRPSPVARQHTAEWRERDEMALEGKDELSDCMAVQENTDFWTRMGLVPVDGVLGAEACRAKCRKHAACRAWTWGKHPGVLGVSHVCFLKRLGEGELPLAVRKAGVVSGYACRPADPCGFEDGIDYVTGNDFARQEHVTSAEICRAVCRAAPGCDAWTWGKKRHEKGVSNMCWLKSFEPGHKMKKVAKHGVVSGLACVPATPTTMLPITSTRSTTTATTTSITTKTRTTQTTTRSTTTSSTLTTTQTSTSLTTTPTTATSTKTTITRTKTPTTSTITSTVTPTTTGTSTSTTSSVTTTESSTTTLAETSTSPRPTVETDAPLTNNVSGAKASAAALSNGTANVSRSSAKAMRSPVTAPVTTTVTNSSTTATSTVTSVTRTRTVTATTTSTSSSMRPSTTVTTTGTNSSTTATLTTTLSTTTVTSTLSTTTLTTTMTSVTSTQTTLTTTNHSSVTLFCFALMRPVGYEPALFAMQQHQRTSLFACDEYSVFSNQTLDGSPGFHVSIINMSLECERGGELRTQMNVDLFEAVWARVVSDGRFKFHAWTVKVEADTVFLPYRLRAVLSDYSDVDTHEKDGMYFNNCRFGLHGPLEVFSRAAVQALGAGWDHCREYFHMACSGPCWWSEDLFIDQCLSQVLYIKRESRDQLLSEDRCNSPKGWRSCKDNSKVAFHPFKAEDEYMECLKNSESNDDSSFFFKKWAVLGAAEQTTG